MSQTSVSSRKTSSLKENVKSFFKKLLTYVLIFGQTTFFSIIKLNSEKNVSFIYSIITLFSKITYYLSRLSQA